MRLAHCRLVSGKPAANGRAGCDERAAPHLSDGRWFDDIVIALVLDTAPGRWRQCQSRNATRNGVNGRKWPCLACRRWPRWCRAVVGANATTGLAIPLL